MLPGQIISSARICADKVSDSQGGRGTGDDVSSTLGACNFLDLRSHETRGISPLSWDNVAMGSSLHEGVSSRPQSARTLTSINRFQSPRSPKVPRQRLHDGLRLFCDRFLGERMDHDLVQEAMHSTSMHTRAIQIERAVPMFSAFYGNRQAADKDGVYGNKVGFYSSRTFNSCLRRLTR